MWTGGGAVLALLILQLCACAKRPCVTKPIPGWSSDAREIQRIFTVLNTLRNRVALGLPPAANMELLDWSDKLTEYAQRWADQCEIRENDSTQTTEGIEYGQTFGEFDIAHNTSAMDILETVFMTWFNESNLFRPSDISSYSPAEKCNNYTQMIWAQTTHIGCGRVEIQDNQIKKVRLFCNYFPKGNIKGESVYIQGSARSACLINNSVADDQFTGLCTLFEPSWAEYHGNIIIGIFIAIFAIMTSLRIINFILNVRAHNRAQRSNLPRELQEIKNNEI